jgi:glycosyltransferase involved in cell wall biosynthesis
MGPSFLDLRVLWPLVRELRREPPDILHCHLLRANLYGRVAARFAGIRKVINTIHGVDEYMSAGDLISRSLRLVERLSAAWVSQYVAVSENARNAVIRNLKLAPKKVSTILNALELAPFQSSRADAAAIRRELEVAPEALVVGAVGRLAPLKNFASLVNWFAGIKSDCPRAQLVIIGDGEDRGVLEDLIARRRLRDTVKLAGFRTDIPRILAALDIFAFPSVSEGLSIALLEAMAAGLPCVVMDVGGNSEAVVPGETGYIIPLSKGAEFKAALLRLLEDGQLRKKMGTAGKNRAFTLFNPQRLAAQYEELYRTLLNQRP